MPNISSNNKRIAKNTVYLYARMLLSTIVSLYTSRVVLNTLGVADYGIYGLVGGVVSMFSFLNSAMSGATSRFLTFELGKKNSSRIKDIFSSALIIHAGIALTIFLLAVTIGLWFLNHKLVIPDGRMTAAYWVFFCSILGMFVSVTQVPYNAAIIAHEKMNIYAYVELMNVFLKLGIVYILLVGNLDKLILYSFLMLGVNIIVACTYRIYCLKNFDETHFRWVWDKSILKPMLSYSGWDLFGNFSVVSRNQGTNFLINIFFGVIYNAASSVASSVHGLLMSLCNNVLTAFRPQIIKYYSSGNLNESVNLLYQSTKFSAILLVLVAIPLIAEMDLVMCLWLGNPPEMSSTFCRILMVVGCVNICESSLNAGIHATGRIKTMSILSGLCYLGVLPLIWLCYHFGRPVEVAYYLAILVYASSWSIKTILVRNYIPGFSVRYYLKHSILPVAEISCICAISVFSVVFLMEDGFVRCVVVLFVDVIVGLLSTAFLALKKEQRHYVYSLFLSKIKIGL